MIPEKESIVVGGAREALLASLLVSNQCRHVRHGDGDELIARHRGGREPDVDEHLPAARARERGRVLLHRQTVVVHGRLLHDAHDRVRVQVHEERTRHAERRITPIQRPGHCFRGPVRVRDLVVPREEVPARHVLELLAHLQQEAAVRDRHLELGPVPQPDHETRERGAVVRRQEPEVVVAGVDDVPHLELAQIDGVERQDRGPVDQAIRESTRAQTEPQLHERRAREGGVDERLGLTVHDLGPLPAEQCRHDLLLPLVQLGEARLARLRARAPHEPHLGVPEPGRARGRVVLGSERPDELRALHRLLGPGRREADLVPELLAHVRCQERRGLGEVLLCHRPEELIVFPRQPPGVLHDHGTVLVQSLDEHLGREPVAPSRQGRGEVNTGQHLHLILLKHQASGDSFIMKKIFLQLFG